MTAAITLSSGIPYLSEREERWWKEKRQTDVSDGEPDLHSGFLQLIRTIAKAVRGREVVRGDEGEGGGEG